MSTLLWGFSLPANSAEIRVSAASNFAAALHAIVEMFRSQTGHVVIVSTGSTGKLYAQITNGAPFDLFFAADIDRPRQLEEQGFAVAGTRFTYAVGKLVLWSSHQGLVDREGQVLKTADFRRLAIANPETAPYGLAARQVLESLGNWSDLQAKLVRGENIAQTYQFVASGNAELGFVALAQLKQFSGAVGSFWEIPQALYQPIEQQVILLKNAREPEAASELLDFLRSDAVREYLQRAGYGIVSH